MNFNRVIIGGNLTRDPELKYIPSGAAVCAFALAVNRYWNDKQTGQRQEETSFVDFEAWGKTAELIAKYCKKGKPLLVEGRLKQDRWQDQASGQNRSKLKIVAEQIQFVGDKREENGGGAPQEGPPPGEDVPF